MTIFFKIVRGQVNRPELVAPLSFLAPQRQLRQGPLFDFRQINVSQILTCFQFPLTSFGISCIIKVSHVCCLDFNAYWLCSSDWIILLILPPHCLYTEGFFLVGNTNNIAYEQKQNRINNIACHFYWFVQFNSFIDVNYLQCRKLVAFGCMYPINEQRRIEL